CKYCNKKGHWYKECMKRLRDEGGEKSKLASGKSNGFAFTAFSSLLAVRSNTDWYTDSGATQHMSDQRWMFSTFEDVKPGTWPVYGIGKENQSLQVCGRGNINIRTFADGIWHDATIYDVLYVPNLGGNLFSVGIAADRGISSNFTNIGVILVKNGKTL